MRAGYFSAASSSYDPPLAPSTEDWDDEYDDRDLYRQAWESTGLLEQHVEYLASRANLPFLVKDRGIRSVFAEDIDALVEPLGLRWSQSFTDPKTGQTRLGVREWMEHTDSAALAIPLYNAEGQLSCWQLRLDNPRPNRENPEKTLKFELPSGVRRGPRPGCLVPDVFPNPQTRPAPFTGIILTEGQAKGDAITGALWCWGADHDWSVVTLTGVTMAYERIELEDEEPAHRLTEGIRALGVRGRDFLLCWDADWRTNRNVRNALIRTGDLLMEAGAASVRIIDIPAEGDPKAGIDDYLASHGRIAMNSLIRRAIPIEELSLPRHQTSPRTAEEEGIIPWTPAHAAWEFLRSRFAALLMMDKGGAWWAWTGAQWASSRSDDAARGVLLNWTKTIEPVWDIKEGPDGEDEYVLNPAYAHWITRLQSPVGQREALQMLAADPQLRRSLHSMDWAFGHELNTPDGMVDLRTGQIARHDPTHMHSLMAGVSPLRAPTPVFDRYLETTFPDASLREYVLDLMVTWLHGDQHQEDFTMMVGPEGGGGKGVLRALMQVILGQYASVPAKAWLMASQADAHESLLASLRGRRWVAQDEVPTAQNRKFEDELNVSLVKALTGGNTVVARRMRQDNEDALEYHPAFSLCLITNDLPVVSGAVTSFMRRVRKLDFSAKFREGDGVHDPDLKNKLAVEAPAILGRLIRRSRRYHERGRVLETPVCVQLSQADYADEADTVSWWLREHTSVVEGKAMDAPTPGASYDHYAAWVRQSALTPLTKTEFARQMRARMQAGAIVGTTGVRVAKARSRASGEVWQNLELGDHPTGRAAVQF